MSHVTLLVPTLLLKAALCQHHDAIVLADQRGTPLKPVVALSASCMDFLKTVLTLNPSLGHALIAKLTSGASPELVSISQTLQMLYVDVIFSILDELQQLKAETVAVSDEPTEERDLPLNTEGLLVEERESEVESQKRVVDAVGAKMDTALDILSFVNPDFAPKDKTLDKLFIRLLNFSFSVAPHPESVKVFPPGKLYSCLLGQKSATLVVKLQDCEEILRQKYTSKSQPDMQAVVQSASPLERCGEKWQETVFEAVHAKRHFLEDKLVSWWHGSVTAVCSMLVQSGNNGVTINPSLKRIMPSGTRTLICAHRAHRHMWNVCKSHS